MARVDALVTPSLLCWARVTAGLDVDEAARRLSVPAEQMAGWEAGESRPTIGQAKRLASMYKRPLAVLYLPEPPETATPPPDYRKPVVQGLGLGPEAHYQIRLARYRRRVVLDLTATEPSAIPKFALNARLHEAADAVAERLRGQLGVDLETQCSWRNQYAALRGWRAGVERQGVLVFQTRGGPWGVVPEEMRGVSLYEDILPVIILTGRDAPNGRIFTLMHELTHLALHTSGICDWTEVDEIEVYCNRVAAAILVPPIPLRERATALLAYTNEPDDHHLEDLSREFCVSREVIARRLLTLGFVTAEYYQRKREEFYQEFIRSSGASNSTKREIRIPGYVNALSTNGPRYIETVLHAYYAGAISLTDVSRFLDMRLRHLPRLERAIMASQ